MSINLVEKCSFRRRLQRKEKASSSFSFIENDFFFEILAPTSLTIVSTNNSKKESFSTNSNLLFLGNTWSRTRSFFFFWAKKFFHHFIYWNNTNMLVFWFLKMSEMQRILKKYVTRSGSLLKSLIFWQPITSFCPVLKSWS